MKHSLRRRTEKRSTSYIKVNTDAGHVENVTEDQCSYPRGGEENDGITTKLNIVTVRPYITIYFSTC